MEPSYPDDVPPALVRAFTSANDQAIWEGGRCRFRLLSYYRKLEADIRADPAEGEARHIVLGVNNTPVNFSGSFHNPIYVVSFCEPDAPAIERQRYGTFVSRVDDVAKMVTALTEQLEELSFDARELLEVRLLRVRYSRDSIIDPEPPSAERWRLMVSQKAKADADDREWRIVVTLSGPVGGAPTEFWISYNTASVFPTPAV